MSDCLISDSVNEIIATAKKQGEISIGQCLSLLGGNRSILLAMLLFSLVNSLPLPGIPGISTFTGIPIIFLGFKLMSGTRQLCLPQSCTNRRLRSKKLLACLEKTVPTLKRIEHHLKPRLPVLSAPPITNLLGILLMVLGLLLALPIPFGNFPLGVTLTILSLGLIERDGVMILIGLACAALCFGLLILLFDQLWEAVVS